MCNFVYIDTHIIGVITVMFFICFLMAILMWCANLKLERENRKLMRKNKRLAGNIENLKDKLYKQEFSVPNITEK